MWVGRRLYGNFDTQGVLDKLKLKRRRARSSSGPLELWDHKLRKYNGSRMRSGTET